MHSKSALQVGISSSAAAVLSVRPLTATFGAEILGLDFTNSVAEETRQHIQRALTEYQVLLFRQQFLNEEQQVRFAEIFGVCRTMWQNPHYPAKNHAIHYLSNVDQNGAPLGRHPDPDSAFWHSDGSWSHKPPLATVLNAVQVPESEGDTQFANLYQVYADLDQANRNRFAKMMAEHHVDISRASRNRRWPRQWWSGQPQFDGPLHQLAWWRKVLLRRWRDGKVNHPLVRLHPITGRPTLFIGDHAWRITDSLWSKGMRLMKEINEMEIKSNAIYSHHWQTGDLLVWDNGSLLHRVMPYDLISQVRIMRRCVVLS
jgi:taurine dioxygenase